MPPKNKKKKPAANPARGFATVSVPSKPKAPEPTETSSAEGPKAEPQRQSIEGEQQQTKNDGEEEKKPQTQHQYSPEEIERHLEESELQLLVEKYGAKCKNDAARQVAKLETDRRVMRQQAVSLNVSEWISSEMLTQILQLAESEEMELGRQLSGREANGVKRSTSQEELCVKVWTLQETLLKLGFPEEKIEDSLKYLLAYCAAGSSRDMVWNLDEALDWLAIHCSADGLPSYNRSNVQAPKDENIVSWINGEI